MVLKIINSVVIPYLILIGLGCIYVHVDSLCEDASYQQGDHDREVYASSVNLLSKEMEAAVLHTEQYIYESMVKEYPYNRKSNETYLSISKFYYSLIQDRTDDNFQKLFSVASYLDEDFESRYDVDNITGIDSIDIDILYHTLIHRYGYRSRGCGVFEPINVHSEYNKEKELYVSRLVKPISYNRFKIIYHDTAYQLKSNLLKLNFVQSDIERGTASIKVRDRITGEEKVIQLELSNYAFRA